MTKVFDGEDEILTIPEAAEMCRLHPRTIRSAITSGRLRAFVIGGRPPLQSGAGLGYRIRKRDLQAWYFGEDSVPKPKVDHVQA